MVGLLMTAIFGSFRMGLNAFHKTSAKNELNQELQILHRRMLAELEVSSISSVSVTPSGNAISFLSPLDPDGQFQLDNQGRPKWQRYVIYYHDSVNKKIFRRVLELPKSPPGPTISEHRVPTPIEYYDPGSGRNSLSFYTTGGQKVTDLVEEFDVEMRPAPVSEVNWRVKVSRNRYGLDSKYQEELIGTASALLRN